MYSPNDADEDVSGHQVRLTEDDTTTITVTVTSEDETETETYTVKVFRAGANVSTLASLSVSPGELAPDFDSDTTSYTVDVDHDVASVTFTFSPTDGNATTDPASGHALTLGDAGTSTAQAIEVASADESDTTTYTVTVNRGDEPDEPDPVTAGLTFTNKDGDTVNVDGLEIPEGTADSSPDTTYLVVLNTAPTADSTVNHHRSADGYRPDHRPGKSGLSPTTDWETAAGRADSDPHGRR